MRKIIFFAPFILFAALCLFLMSAGLRLHAIHALWLILFLAGGVLLCRHEWWGAVLGMLPGAQMILMGMSNTGQVINELPIGLGITAFYLLCGIAVLRGGIRRKHEE